MEHYSYKELMNYPKSMFTLEPLANKLDSGIYFSPAMKAFITGNKIYIGGTESLFDNKDLNDLIGGWENLGKIVAELINRYGQKDLGLNNEHHFSDGLLGVYQFPDSEDKNELICVGPVVNPLNPKKVALAIMLMEEAFWEREN